MTDPVQLQMMLSNLQNPGLATFQQLPNTMNNLQPDIFNMVRTAVQSELARLGLGNKVTTPAVTAGMPASNPNMPQSSTPAANPVSAILPIIGAAYTQEQQEWISQPQHLIGIPGFLMSDSGKTLLNMALDEYQKFSTQQK